MYIVLTSVSWSITEIALAFGPTLLPATIDRKNLRRFNDLHQTRRGVPQLEKIRLRHDWRQIIQTAHLRRTTLVA